MLDESRKSIQSILDAITPHLFGGADVMFTLEAVMACPQNFPKILVGIASACLESERNKLMFRSGRCLPFGKHAGQKKKVNDEAKKALPPLRKQRNSVANKVEDLLVGAGKNGMNSRQLTQAMKASTKQVSNAVMQLFTNKRIVRKPIEHVEKHGPQFTYFAPKAEAGVEVRS